MRHALRTVGVTGAAVETSTETAGCRLAAAQVLTMAGTAGRRAVQGSETSMIDEGVGPVLRME
jgi:hypothetical protein